MTVFHVDHKLADFDKWIAVFRESTMRKDLAAKMGVATRRVVQDANDPNHCIVIQDADSREALDEYLNQPQVQERFTDTSVFAEKPRVIAGYEGSDLGTAPDGDYGAFFVDHQLADYDKWQENWNSNQEQRNATLAENGVVPIRLLRDIDDGNHAIVLMAAPNRGAVEEALNSATSKAAFANQSVFKEAPTITGHFTPVEL